ncbi:MAG: hypothetical protein SV253_01015 [Halobacteria archaeon]|nr:hypothetical protein [Halobacteria archaeon]
MPDMSVTGSGSNDPSPDFETVRKIVYDEGLTGEELTARQILELVNANTDRRVEVSSSHKIATILGSNQSHPDLVIRETSPYTYEFGGDTGGDGD